MTREFLVATSSSLGLHLALLFGVWPNSGKIAPLDDWVESDYIRLEAPVVSPDEPELIEDPEAELRPLDLAPPMQSDRPDPVRPDSFVQKLQPPRPEGVVISAQMNIVPEVRNSGVVGRVQVFDVTMLDQRPVPRYQARPQYPFEMRRNGTTGEVVVDFIVDTRGEVQNAFALRSSHREFEGAAVQAVSKWRFRPGRKDGRDVPTHMQVPIVFTLNEP
jgi:protein TonB